MSLNLPKRIVKETERLLAEPAPGISAQPHEDNLRYFDVVIAGPTHSPYDGGMFKLELFLPDDYPMAPPKVRFLTRIYHPNIDKLGRICLDILKDKWSPALQIRTVLLSIQALLSGVLSPSSSTLSRLEECDKLSGKCVASLLSNYWVAKIVVLLEAPNPDDPLANDVAQQWKENEKLALQTAREWTGKFAK